MYDSHIWCEDYKELKDAMIAMLNGEDVGFSTEALSDKLYELYSDGKMSSCQYDELMMYLVYLQDLL